MFRNYLLTAFRSFSRHKLYPIICIAGLSLALACFILVTLFILYEHSYDEFHTKKDRIYRIVTESAHSPIPLALYIKDEIPEIEKVTRIRNIIKGKRKVFSHGNKAFYEDKFFVVDPDFFDIFSFKFIKGNPKTALIDKNSIVITESISDKFFAETDPIGKVLNFDDRKDFVVSGVIEDVPVNAHFRFDLLANFENYRKNSDILNSWGTHNQKTYILTKANVNIPDLENKISDIYIHHSNRNERIFGLQKITDIHLNSHLKYEFETNGSMSDIYIFVAIAVIVLLVAGINNINLTSALYTKRSGEIGIRKSIGASRKQVMFQFLFESVFYSMIALVMAFVIVELFLPQLNNLLGKDISLLEQLNFPLIALILFITVLVGILSGSYTAFYVSGVKPAVIVKGQLGKNLKQSNFRKYLISAQFAVSVAFLIFIITVSRQLNYLNNKDLGFDKNNLVCIPVGKFTDMRFETFRNKIEQLSSIENTSKSDFLLSMNPWLQNASWEGMDESQKKMIRWIAVDEDFIETYKLDLIEGKNFTPRSVGGPVKEYILNESAVNFVGWDNPIGKKFRIMGDGGKVIGVVRDFHTKSLHQKLAAAVLIPLPSYASHLAVKYQPGSLSSTLNGIRNVWNEIMPDRPFTYFFFSDDYESLYANERRTRTVFLYSALITILVSSLGLFGLTAFMVERRVKEIGIRKVLGSSVKDIVLLFNKETSSLILIANILAFPVAWYVMHRWLENFAYRVSISPLTFVIAGIVTFMIAVITVSLKTVKAALANPVESIKYE